MVDAPASARMLAADRRFTRLRPATGGVEFQVFGLLLRHTGPDSVATCLEAALVPGTLEWPADAMTAR